MEIYSGEMVTHLQKIPRYDKWIIQKVARSYLEAFEDSKENLVCLTVGVKLSFSIIVSSCAP